MDVSSSFYTSIYQPLQPKNRSENVSRTIFIENIEGHLYKANQLSKEVLGLKKSSPAVFCDGGFYAFFINFLDIGSSGRSDGRGELICAGVTVMLFAAGFFGKHFAKYLNLRDRMDENKTFKNEFSHPDASCMHHPHVIKINCIVENYSKLLAKKSENSAINCALTLAALAGGVFLVIGVVFSAAPIAILGGVLTLGALGAAIFKFAFISTSTDKDVASAKAINALWKQLKKEGHNKNIERTTEPFYFNPSDADNLRNAD